MESNGKGRVSISPGGDTEMIWLNMTDPWTEVDGERASLKSRHPILSDPAVREALALLLDRKSVQEFVYGRTGVGHGERAQQPTAVQQSEYEERNEPGQGQRAARRGGLEAWRQRRPRKGRAQAQLPVPEHDQPGAPEGADHLQAGLRQGRHRDRAEGRHASRLLLLRHRQSRYLRQVLGGPADAYVHPSSGSGPLHAAVGLMGGFEQEPTSGWD